MAIPAIAAGIGLVQFLVDKFVADPAQKAKALTEGINYLQTIDKAQLEVNKTEAAHRSIFVAGWRPFIGWTCGTALAYTYVLAPMLQWAFLALQLDLPPLPKLDDSLWQLTMGMLGMGGLRTFEKIKGVTK